MAKDKYIPTNDISDKPLEIDLGIQSAKQAFASHPQAKVCYENARGEWLYTAPDKSFGEVVKTYKKTDGNQIKEFSGKA